jgi:predicted metal-binding protein
MSISVDVDVDIFCACCAESINDEDEIVCKECYEKREKNIKNDIEILMHKLENLFNEAVINKPITVSGKDALFIKDAVRCFYTK